MNGNLRNDAGKIIALSSRTSIQASELGLAIKTLLSHINDMIISPITNYGIGWALVQRKNLVSRFHYQFAFVFNKNISKLLNVN